MSLGFWSGANEFRIERRARIEARERFKDESLEKTKSIVIPELLTRLENNNKKSAVRKERVAMAETIGFSRKAALALEKTGQLEFELEKLSKKDISGEYIRELTEMIENELNPSDDTYDEVLANSVKAGLDINDTRSDDERLEGLMKAISATNEEDLNEALINLLPTEETETLKPARIEYNIYKGGKVKDTVGVRVRSELAKRIAPMLETKFIPTGTDAAGLQVYQLEDENKNRILLQIADSIKDKYIDPSILQDDELLTSIASNIVQDYSDYVKATNGLETNPSHFQEHFDSIFLAELYEPASNVRGLWEQKLQVPTPTGGGTGGGSDGGTGGGSETPPIDPSIPEPLQIPTI
jgi:hypothetical protein